MQPLVLALAGTALVGAGGAAVPGPSGSAPEFSTPQIIRLGPSLYRETVFLTDGQTEMRLAWRSLRWGTAEVLLDGRPLLAGSEYELDEAGGILRLPRPCGGSLLQISYRVLPYQSVTNRAALYQGRRLAPRPDSLPARLHPRLAEQLAGVLQGGAGEPVRVEGPRLSLSLAPDTEANPDLREEVLGGQRVTQSQQQLAGNGAAGKVTYYRTDPIDPNLAEGGREEFRSDLSVRPNSSSRLLLQNHISRESLFSDSYEESERQRLQFDRTFGKSATSLVWEHRRTDGAEVSDSLDSLSLSLLHPFSRSLASEGYFTLEDSLYRGRQLDSLVTLRQLLGRALNAQASLQYRSSTFSGDRMDSGVSLTATPGRGEVTLGLRRSESERYGDYQRLSVEANAPVSRRLQFTGEVTHRTSDALASVGTLGLGMAARPTSKSLLQTAFSQSVGGGVGTERTGTTRFMLAPSAALQVQLGYDLFSSDENGSSRNALWIITAGGQRYVRLEGYALSLDRADLGNYTDALYRVEVRPFSPIAISGHLRRSGADDNEKAVAGLGTTLTLLRGVDVSATYRRPVDLPAADAGLHGKDVKLSLAPVSGLRLYGQYSVRPEDERGGLLEQIHRSLGLETQFGSLSLQGSVTQMEGTLAPDPGQRLDLLASLNLGQRTQLFGGLRTYDPSPLDPNRTRIYRVGISQSAGPSFFVLLEGQLGYLLEAGGTTSLSADDSRAQARLGIRF